MQLTSFLQILYLFDNYNNKDNVQQLFGRLLLLSHYITLHHNHEELRNTDYITQASYSSVIGYAGRRVHVCEHIQLVETGQRIV